MVFLRDALSGSGHQVPEGQLKQSLRAVRSSQTIYVYFAISIALSLTA